MNYDGIELSSIWSARKVTLLRLEHHKLACFFCTTEGISKVKIPLFCTFSEVYRICQDATQIMANVCVAAFKLVVGVRLALTLFLV